MKVDNKSPIELLEYLKVNYSYNCMTGELGNNITGKKYNRVTKSGYLNSIHISIHNIRYTIPNHRLCWFLYYGSFPEFVIDHRNKIKSENNIDNLRACSTLENSRNRSKNINKNTSNFKGVNGYFKSNGKFVFSACINVDKKRKVIGVFKDELTASYYYDAAARYYYGEFASCNHGKQFLSPMSLEDLKRYKKENVKLKLKNSKEVIQKDKNELIVKIWSSIKEAAEFYNISRSAIGNCIRGESKYCLNFKWELKK